jgi:tRNA pseudouridine32 synthase/23S rRNA pseudouridine746 synthase
MLLDILHSDKDLVVVNKPAGRLCVPGLSEPENLLQDVQAEFPNARVVHRLDMATSGIVIFPLHHEAQKHLGKQFENRLVSKTYIAIVANKLKHQSGHIHVPLLCDWERRPKQKVDWLNGKWGETKYRQLNSDELNTRVELKPITGRTHQLRVHMLYLGHPILGDKFYNQNGSDKQAERLLLHAEKISFYHPRTNKTLTIHSDAPF